MLSLQEIKNGVAVAAQEFPIKKAELFGSYANGNSTCRKINCNGFKYIFHPQGLIFVRGNIPKPGDFLPWNGWICHPKSSR